MSQLFKQSVVEILTALFGYNFVGMGSNYFV